MMLPDLPWATYIRTSTFEQGEKSSPLKQFLANVAWAKNNGRTIPGIESGIIGSRVNRGDYIFVDHQTGTNDDRPDWQRFMTLARSGKVGGIVCYVVDRAARNLADAVKIHRDLRRMSVGFQFAIQNFDDTPAGTLMFQIFAAFAEYEVKIIAERTHDGRRKRILGIGGKKDGKPRLQGPPLYGYRLEDGIPVEDKKEGPVARFFLRKALESTDNTSRKIAKALNEAGHRTRSGKLWRDTTVSKNLRKAYSYAGVYRHRHGLEAAIKAHDEAVKLMGAAAPPLDTSAIETIETMAYPAMITHDEASLILARAEKNRAERRGRPSREYALTSYLWCDVCGCRWYAKKGLYYCGCTQLGKPRCRAIGSVAQHRIESGVFEGMRAYLRRPDVYYSLALQDYNARRGSSQRGREEIEKLVKQASKEQAHYDEQATEFGLSPRQREIARTKSQQLELRLAELKAELRQLSSVVPLPSQAGIVAAFGQMLAILDRIVTFAEKREFIEATMQRVLTDGRRVKVTGTLDVQAVANKGSKGGIYSIQNLDPGSGDHDVGRLQVAVDDSLRMRGRQRIRDLGAVTQDKLCRQTSTLQTIGQRFAFDQFHHQVIRPGVVQRADVRMIQRRDCARLAVEASTEFLMRDLDGDGPAEAGVAGLVDRAHAAFANLAENLVRAEPATGLDPADQAGGGFESGLHHRTIGVLVEQRSDFAEEVGIAGAGVREKGIALAGSAFAGEVK
jgi:DNA invertase Pin-like site-specific DNA recombinase